MIEKSEASRSVKSPTIWIGRKQPSRWWETNQVQSQKQYTLIHHQHSHMPNASSSQTWQNTSDCGSHAQKALPSMNRRQGFNEHLWIKQASVNVDDHLKLTKNPDPRVCCTRFVKVFACCKRGNQDLLSLASTWTLKSNVISMYHRYCVLVIIAFSNDCLLTNCFLNIHSTSQWMAHPRTLSINVHSADNKEVHNQQDYCSKPIEQCHERK
jgi:hypothetical protein